MSGNLIFGQDKTANSLHSISCDSNGHLDVNVATIDPGAGLATEAKQDDMITDLTQIATNTSRLAPQLSRTEAIPVQIMVGSSGANYDALRANGQDLMVMIDDMNPDVAVNSGLSTATKQDTMITHLADIDNQTNGLLTYQVLIHGNQTNGNQVVKCMGNNGGTNVQLKVDANGVLETSGGGGGGGDATAANQTLQLAQETIIAGDTTSLDSKITQGSDVTLTNAQQVLVYGRDSGGVLDALRTDASGHLEVVVDDFVKGQATMANSFPVTVASDQSRLDVDTVKVEVTISQVNQAIINGNSFTSTAVDMRGYERISFFGTSTNTSDMIYVLVSADDITYYNTGENVGQDFTSGDFSYNATLGARYFKLQQGSADFNSNFTITCISSKK
jgi:hypothetical protein